ncbi:MAG: FAD-dependent oxidoreductase [Bifidobacteriaceae bacterium]|jgi:electron transfer flavoprotein-quinone oxidoreductase|nr:FAD-dependent oxidoreductase [Bifidobacteriaceae bacterium]
MAESFDVAVVGAGPAGSAAALSAAQQGLSVLLLDRGEFVGSKNLSGGMLLTRVLEELVPDYATSAPLERPVEHQRVMVTAAERALTIDIGNAGFTRPPYNGFTVLRRRFDAWLADQAATAGAVVVAEAVVDDLITEGSQVVGLKVRGPEGEVRAKVVVLADGVNSLLAKKAGLRGPHRMEDLSLGVKELLALPSDVIEARFGLLPGRGAAYAVIGDFLAGMGGGGFVYTNRETVSLGAVVALSDLVELKIPADQILENFKAVPEIARLLEGAKLIEYGAHLVPEGGYAALPKLFGNGVLVAGDAAGLVVNTGLLMMGMNLALDSGRCAGIAAGGAIAAGDVSAGGLARYRQLLEQSVGLSALAVHRRAPQLLRLKRIFDWYPALVNDLVEDVVTVGPGRKEGLIKIARRHLRPGQMMTVAGDALRAARAL